MPLQSLREATGVSLDERLEYIETRPERMAGSGLPTLPGFEFEEPRLHPPLGLEAQKGTSARPREAPRTEKGLRTPETNAELTRLDREYRRPNGSEIQTASRRNFDSTENMKPSRASGNPEQLRFERAHRGESPRPAPRAEGTTGGEEPLSFDRVGPGGPLKQHLGRFGAILAARAPVL